MIRRKHDDELRIHEGHKPIKINGHESLPPPRFSHPTRWPCANCKTHLGQAVQMLGPLRRVLRNEIISAVVNGTAEQTQRSPSVGSKGEVADRTTRLTKGRRERNNAKRGLSDELGVKWKKRWGGRSEQLTRTHFDSLDLLWLISLLRAVIQAGAPSPLWAPREKAEESVNGSSERMTMMMRSKQGR